jgi:hypothetical protein
METKRKAMEFLEQNVNYGNYLTPNKLVNKETN